MKKFYVLLALALFLSPERAETFTGALPVGPGISFTCQTSAPSPLGKDRKWVRCSDHHEIQTNSSNVDVDVTASIGATGVTPGSYSNANITVGSDGRLTLASNGSAGGGGGYTTIQQNATPLTQRSVVNFSPRLLCADNSGATRTDCDLSSSGVTAATYGDASHVPQIAVDAYGRVTSASNVAISGLPTQTGHTDQFLVTDGVSASWSGSSLTSDGVTFSTTQATSFGGSSNSFANGAGVDSSHQNAFPSVSGSTYAVLDLAQTFTKSQNIAAVALTDASSIATDASLGNTFTVTLGGNRTLSNPTNLVAGGTYLWIVTQDGTGSRTLAYGSAFKWPSGTAPTLTTVAAGVDMISCVYTGTTLKCVAQLNFQ